MARHTCMQMCLPNPALHCAFLLIIICAQAQAHAPPLLPTTLALICPICRVRNNKSAAKNKRCENCCQFAEAPPRSGNSGKILFQQIKSTCRRGREAAVPDLLGIFYHLNARHTGVNFEYPGRRLSHSRSCHPESAFASSSAPASEYESEFESESVPSAYRTLWCCAWSVDWAGAAASDFAQAPSQTSAAKCGTNSTMWQVATAKDTVGH